jgi:hypothetical protein
MIELFLSSDGKHTVHASADTPEQLKDLVPAAKVLYREVIREFGGKVQPLPEATPSTSNGHAAVGKRIDTVAQAQAAVTPLCPMHKTAMKLRQGRLGPFWSCPRRKPDGRWCQVTQDVTDTGNGYAQAA